MLKITKIPTHAPYIASYICLVSRRRRWPLGQLHVNLLRIRRMAALGFSVGSQHGQQRRQHIKARVLCVCVCRHSSNAPKCSAISGQIEPQLGVSVLSHSKGSAG